MLVMTNGGKLKDIYWTISNRENKGCVITAVGEINGIQSELIRFYLDLSDNMITPDDAAAQTIFSVFPVGGSNLGWGIKLGGEP
jgi:hypothetical protein